MLPSVEKSAALIFLNAALFFLSMTPIKKHPVYRYKTVVVAFGVVDEKECKRGCACFMGHILLIHFEYVGWLRTLCFFSNADYA